MERLNEIMARTMQQAQRHRQTTGQQPAQDTTQGKRPGQLPPGEAPLRRLRRPLREQTAHLGKPSQSAAQALNSHNQGLVPARGTTTPPNALMPPAGYLPPRQDALSGGRVTRGQGELPPPPLPRPQAPLQRPASVQHMPVGADVQPPYQQRPRPPQEPQHLLRRDNYQADVYLARADVAEEWDGDAAGMRYGDWESDEYELQGHVQPGTELAPRVNRPLNTRELPPAPEARAYVAYTPRSMQMPPVPPTLPAPQVSIQEVRHYQQRTTQPLNQRSPLRTGQDIPPSRIARPTRQLVPPEQVVQSIPAPYTAPTEVCPTCKGAGYLRADVPFGHPNFGKPIACECKEAERAEKRRLQLYSISNMDAFRNQSFKNFNPNVSRTVQRAYQVAFEYARDPDGWLVLIGPNGCGKTHLAAAIANQSLEDGSVVLFMTVIDLLDHLRATFVPTATEVYDQLFAKICEAGVLILDDLGAQQSSPWANEKMFQLLNYRYNSRFPTVITTNNIGLHGIEERIRSRMMDTSLVITLTFDGSQDYRLRNPRRG
jgi:DNA replication protein DnaC